LEFQRGVSEISQVDLTADCDGESVGEPHFLGERQSFTASVAAQKVSNVQVASWRGAAGHAAPKGIRDQEGSARKHALCAVAHLFQHYVVHDGEG
jgi:hypothetical protein